MVSDSKPEFVVVGYRSRREAQSLAPHVYDLCLQSSEPRGDEAHRYLACHLECEVVLVTFR